MKDVELMYDDKQILACCISLLYWESHKKVQTESRADAMEVLRLITPRDKMVDNDFIGDNRITVAKLIRNMLETNITEEGFTHVYMKQLVRMAISDDEGFYQSIMTSIDPEMSDSQIQQLCHAQKKRIADYFAQRAFTEQLKKSINKIYYGNGEHSLAEQIVEISTAINDYSSKVTKGEGTGIHAPNVVAGFRSDAPESIKAIWEVTKELVSPDSIMRTGYQGLNRMLGEPGGFFRGDTIVFGALQHNYKSGSMSDLVVDIQRNNSPYFFKDPVPGKEQKGALLHISLENTQDDDLIRMYRRIYVQQHGRMPSMEDIMSTDGEEIARTINDYIGETGFIYIYLKMNPSENGYLDVQKAIMDVEAEGVEIHMLVIDYLSMLNLKGIPRAGDGTEYQDLFRRMRNFCTERKITLVTPHQLSTEATYLKRDGHEVDFVTKVAGASYWSRSKQIDREIDIEIIQHIVTIPDSDGNKRAYLTMALGKNRRTHNIPLDHKSVALPFHPELGLVSDMGGEPTFVELRKLTQAGGNAEDMW